MTDVTTDSLRIATEHYHWKPARAFFTSFELEEYARAGVRFDHPVLDLGCSDGTFTAMLRERGVLDHVDVALDYTAGGLRQARENTSLGALQADARALPFKTGTFASVLANGVFCSVRTEVDRSIAEVHRVLAEGGLLVLTLPTARVDETQLIPRILRRAGAPRLADRYLRTLNRRLDVYQLIEEEEWCGKLERTGLAVEQVQYYFTPRQAFWSNLLTLQPFRIFALLKLIGARPLRRLVARLQETLFRPLFLKEQRAVPTRAHGSSVLIVARKRS